MMLFSRFTIFLMFISAPFFAQNMDIDMLREINLNRNKSLDGTMKFVTDFAIVPEIAIPVGMLVAGFISKDKALKNKGLVVAVSGIFNFGLTTILKHSINRNRPFITYPYLDKQSGGGSPSFPSGHTSGAFCLATALSLHYPKWYVIAPSFVFASCVGYSRMHLGVHYPSDVLVGALLGTGSSFLTFYVNKWIFNPKKKEINLDSF